MSDCIRREHSVWTTCHCERCRRQRSVFRKSYRLGHYRRPDSDAAWSVIQRLVVGRGYSTDALASALGVTPRYAYSLRTATVDDGRRFVIGPRYALRIISNQHRAPAVGKVSATGTRRRLDGLSAMGWPRKVLAERLGMHWRSLHAIQRGETTSVTVNVADRIADLYDKLSMSPGPSAATRKWAVANRLAPPLAWDDDTIDDPDAKPHMPRGEHRGNPGADLPPIEQIVAEVNRGSLAGVAAHYRVNQRTIERRLSGAGYRARRVGAHTYVYVKEDAA